MLGGARKDEHQKMQRYFGILPYRSSNHKIWRNAVKTDWKLRDVGVTVPWNDITIACQYNYRVYSIDKNFPAMANTLGFPLYKPGYGGRHNPE